MGELASQLAEAARPLPAPDLVRPVLLEPSGGLTLGEPLPPGSEVSQEKIDPFLRIEGRAPRSLWLGLHVRKPPPGSSISTYSASSS